MTDPCFDLILTRPISRSREFAAGIEANVKARLRIHFAPVIEIEGLGIMPDLSASAGVIITSSTTLDFVAAAPALIAYCVGDMTTQAARRAGFVAQKMGDNADELVNAIVSKAPKGPLFHLHGEHTLGSVAKRLSSAGIDTESIAVYTQSDKELTAETHAILRDSASPIVPLFSPRSARLFAAQVPDASPRMRIITISAQVAQALPSNLQGRTVIAAASTATAVRSEIARIISG